MAAKLIVTSIAALSLVCAVGCGGPQKPAEVPEGQTAEAVDEGGEGAEAAGEGGEGAETDAEGGEDKDAAAPQTSSEAAPEEEEAASE